MTSTLARRCRASPTRGSSPAAGQFVNDVQLPGMAYAAFLRSPYAHARIRSIDTLGGRGVARRDPCLHRPRGGRDMSPIPEAGRHRGDRRQGRPPGTRSARSGAVRRRGGGGGRRRGPLDRVRGARRLIVVDYEELPVVTDPLERAMEHGRRSRRARLGRQHHDEPGHRPRRPRRGLRGRRRHASSRHRPVEPDHRRRRSSRAAASPTGTPTRDTLTFWDSTQNPHPLRSFLAETLSMPEASIHVIQPHVGGALRAQAAAVPGGAGRGLRWPGS